ncbi:MAG: putative PEP-binding protein, partial [Balneolaceae bacterium]
MEVPVTGKNVSIKGVPASPGVAIGKVFYLFNTKTSIRPEKVDDEQVEYQNEKYGKALKAATDELLALKNQTIENDVSDILDAQIEILNDPELVSLIGNKIKQHHYEAAYAVFSSFNQYIEIFEDVGNERLRDRTSDLISLRDMIIDILKRNRNEDKFPDKSIIFAENVSPARMISFSQSEVEGVVMHKGGFTSHAVILAQSLGIPCIIGVDTELIRVKNGENVVLDGESGELILRPDDSVIEKFEIRKREYLKELQNRIRLAELPDETACGYPFIIRANVEFLEELPGVDEVHMKGVGLLRTETLFLQHEKQDIGHQEIFYNSVLESTAPNPVVIRLFDVGGDKHVSTDSLEANPYLGWRGIRMLLSDQKLMQNQLRAILKISGKYPGRIKILVPMVSVLSEIDSVKKEIEIARA